MRLIRQLSPLPAHLRGGAVTIGNFDGVHRGHAFLVDALLRRARDLPGPGIVFTFEPHPVRLLRPDAAPPPLTWIERKAELLAALGVDAIIACPTTRKLLNLSAADFFQQVIVDQLYAKAILEGPNFYFGRGREGDVQTLETLCAGAGISLQIVEPVRFDAAGGVADNLVAANFVSSSRIRDRLRAGRAAEAREMLGRPYRIRGMVTHGAGRGAALGFPTANLDGVDTLAPAHGVYAARATVDGVTYAVAVNIGPNPTFGDAACKIECHLIDFAGSLYGRVLEVDFLARLRQIRTFADADQLQRQLPEDVAAARAAHASERAVDAADDL